MIKVLGLALYGPLAASTRYRLGQYVPGLAELGIDLQIKSLLGDEYLRRRFSGGGPPLIAMARDGAERLKQLRDIAGFDLVMVHCELFPFMPGWLERALIRKPYIYDMDDAFYLRYRLGRKRIARSVLGDKFDSVMAGAAAISRRVLSFRLGRRLELGLRGNSSLRLREEGSVINSGGSQKGTLRVGGSR